MYKFLDSEAPFVKNSSKSNGFLQMDSCSSSPILPCLCIVTTSFPWIWSEKSELSCNPQKHYPFQIFPSAQIFQCSLHSRDRVTPVHLQVSDLLQISRGDINKLSKTQIRSSCFGTFECMWTRRMSRLLIR